MTLRLRHIRLRAQTSGGLFGADIPLKSKLCIFWADNTKGKSTSLQAVIYALGLERMLSARREIPLPYAMTSHLEDPVTGERREITQSWVAVELENGAGEVVTAQRNVVATTDRKLISVFMGPALSAPGSYAQRDFFALDPGAATREAGFHRFLADFAGWTLPEVKRYDGGNAKLYLETIFPLFYVEQKLGWSAIPAPIPTFFQIRDVTRRSVEFLLGLDTHKIELERQQLELDAARLKASWAAKLDEMRRLAGTVFARVEAAPHEPTVSAEHIRNAHLTVRRGESEWVPLAGFIGELREHLETLAEAVEQPMQGAADDVAAEIGELTEQIGQLNSRRSQLFRDKEAARGQQDAIVRRLEAINEDLQKNLDNEKLAGLGSAIVRERAADHCPTCDQPISDTLLAQGVVDKVLPIPDNISYLRAQRTMFQRSLDQATSALSIIDDDLSIAAQQVADLSSRLRGLKADLISPIGSPSAAAIAERITLEERVRNLHEAQSQFEQELEELANLSAEYARILASQAELPSSRFSAEDRTKLSTFEASIRRQLAAYNFSTFPPAELGVSPESYRPEKEGFEIGFELSASDAIRLKWAYQLGLLETGLGHATNHPGFVVFDEPRQQETAEVSFQHLLEHAAYLGTKGLQVVLATSESLDHLRGLIAGLDCEFLVFEGPIIKPLQG